MENKDNIQEESIVYVDIENKKIYTDFFTYKESNRLKRRMIGLQDENIDDFDLDMLNYIYNKSRQLFICDLCHAIGSDKYLFDWIFEQGFDARKLVCYLVTTRINIQTNINNRKRRFGIEGFRESYDKVEPNLIPAFKLHAYMLYSIHKAIPQNLREDINNHYIESIKRTVYKLEKRLTDDDSETNKKLTKQIKTKQHLIEKGLMLICDPSRTVFNMTYQPTVDYMVDMISNNYYSLTISLVGIFSIIFEETSLSEFYDMVGFNLAMMVDREYYHSTIIRVVAENRRILNKYNENGEENRYTKVDYTLANILNNIFINGNKQIILLGTSKNEITFGIEYSVDIETALNIVATELKVAGLEELLDRATIYRGTAKTVWMFDTSDIHNINIKNIGNKKLNRRYYATTDEDIAEYKKLVE